MSLTEVRAPNELALAYGHENKRVRLRAVGEERDYYSKYINKKLTSKVAVGVLVLSAFIATIQITTISLVVGEYSFNFDYAADIGAGIWTSLPTLITAMETIWCLKNPKYWKLHLSFALNIISTILLLFLLFFQLGGNIPHIKYKVGSVMYADSDKKNDFHYRDENLDKYSLGVMAASLGLNSLMTFAALLQLIGCFFLTIITGRAICCGSNNKSSGRLFELEIAGSTTKDAGIMVLKKTSDSGKPYRNEMDLQRTISTPEDPPSYCNSIAKVI